MLIINTVVPFLFMHAKRNGGDVEKSLELLEHIPAENNSIIRNWSKLGFPSKNALDSQAYLQLKKNYCDEKKCLQCRVGHKLLSRNENPFHR